MHPRSERNPAAKLGRQERNRFETSMPNGPPATSKKMMATTDTNDRGRFRVQRGVPCSELIRRRTDCTQSIETECLSLIRQRHRRQILPSRKSWNVTSATRRGSYNNVKIRRRTRRKNRNTSSTSQIPVIGRPMSQIPVIGRPMAADE